MNKSNSVDEYIAAVPEEFQSKLRAIRAIFQAAAPEVEEKISYGMPYYTYKGRLGYFAWTKNHIGLYALFPDEETLQTDLKNYSTSKGTIRFPNNEKLPITLIKKLIKTRVKLNDQAKKHK